MTDNRTRYLTIVLDHFTDRIDSNVFYYSTFKKWCEEELFYDDIQDCLNLDAVEELGEDMYLYHK